MHVQSEMLTLYRYTLQITTNVVDDNNNNNGKQYGE